MIYRVDSSFPLFSLVLRPFRFNANRRSGGATEESRGFVLMEVLVSVTILAVGVTVLLQSITNSLDANRLTREYTKAIFLAQKQLWKLEQQYAYEEEQPTGTTQGEFRVPFQDYAWKQTIRSVERQVEYQLKVTISWMHRNKEMQYSLETIVPMRRNERDLKV